MTEDKNREQDKLSCHVCRAEIPKAAALHAEGREYVLHFCSPGCLVDWEQKGGSEGNPPSER